ncbi:MAG: hypothetical protein GEU79_11985 [Acidimicrobiia bacterium]|nr:hypothetical protein [Acidimicrobiia bacterium]
MGHGVSAEEVRTPLSSWCRPHRRHRRANTRELRGLEETVSTEFLLPDIGEGLAEAEIVRWLVAEGETVAVDEPLVEVETDKAVVDIPSPWAGIVRSHGAAEGETIEVGAVLVTIDREGDMSEPIDNSDTPESESESAAPIVGTISDVAEELPSTAVQAAEKLTGVKALPLVRKLARDLGVNLTEIEGSGKDGRITRDDVIAAAEADTDEPVEIPPKVGLPPVPGAPSRKAGRTRLSKLRRTIADNMSQSWREVPHVTTFDEVDATRLLAVRAALARRHETKIPVEALVVGAVLPALAAYPNFNATLDESEIEVHGQADIGIAVDTPDGLLVAVIRDADSKSVLELASEVERLGQGARARSLAADELRGQTFTVSNIGALGGGHGTPIVPPGTTAILSVGRATEKPVVVEGRVTTAPLLPLSLSYDHRIIDGGEGRRFMAMLMENLTEPALFLA